MNSGVFIEPVVVPELGAKAILEIAERRSKYYGKHGERFDRRLYAEHESLIRIYIELDKTGIIKSKPKIFQKLLKIQRSYNKKAKKAGYQDFP